MLSIVLPAYSEADNVKPLSERIIDTVKQLGIDFEIIFVDDGSRDGTFLQVKELSEKDPHIRGIKLSRNFGHQVALYAGLIEAKGERIIMMDADGQHPPELISELIDKLGEGYDVVNTIRKESKNTGFFKRGSSKLFYRIFNLLSDIRIEPAAADFRIMNRKALDAFLSLGEHNRFTRGLVTWMGFNQTSIPYIAPERFSGKSKYTFRKMRRFAFDGLTSFSTRPLRISTLLGFLILIFGIAYAIYAIIMFIIGHTNPGWTSLLITILIMGGVQLFSIGIIGEYIARIYYESKGRPHFFIESRTDQS